jgi:hypothetical protein
VSYSIYQIGARFRQAPCQDCGDPTWTTARLDSQVRCGECKVAVQRERVKAWRERQRAKKRVSASRTDPSREAQTARQGDGAGSRGVRAREGSNGGA